MNVDIRYLNVFASDVLHIDGPRGGVDIGPDIVKMNSRVMFRDEAPEQAGDWHL